MGNMIENITGNVRKIQKSMIESRAHVILSNGSTLHIMIEQLSLIYTAK